MYQKLKDQEKELHHYKKSSQILKEKVHQYELKEQNEKKIQCEIEKVKQNLLNARNSEVEKFNDIFENFPFNNLKR